MDEDEDEGDDVFENAMQCTYTKNVQDEDEDESLEWSGVDVHVNVNVNVDDDVGDQLMRRMDTKLLYVLLSGGG